MIKKEILIGFSLGLLSNIVGMLLYILIFSELSVQRTLVESLQNDFIGILITAGALLNFLPFFVFLKWERTYRARGVLLATILAALTMAILKLT